MNILVATECTTTDFRGWLCEKMGNVAGHSTYCLLGLLPAAVLVLLPWPVTSITALILAAATLFVTFAEVYCGIFGHPDLLEEGGYPDAVRTLGTGRLVAEILRELAWVVSSFAVVFLAIANISPQDHFVISNPSIPLIDFEYFSMVTITTLGYGDIQPTSWLVKLLCMFELFFGILILFVGIAMVIGASMKGRLGRRMANKAMDGDDE